MTAEPPEADPTAGERAALRNAGPWEHHDGTPCPHYMASRPRPDAENYWWCTEHQQYVRRATPDAGDARVCQHGNAVRPSTVAACGCIHAGDASEHHPKCYQSTGVPDDLPDVLCDCRVLLMLDDASTSASEPLSEDERASLYQDIRWGRVGPTMRTVERIVAAHRAAAAKAAGEPLSEAEADSIDFEMGEHMYRHSISNNINRMGCDVGCRTKAIKTAVDKVLVARIAREVTS